jgi:hypothetical protein
MIHARDQLVNPQVATGRYRSPQPRPLPICVICGPLQRSPRGVGGARATAVHFFELGRAGHGAHNGREVP